MAAGAKLSVPVLQTADRTQVLAALATFAGKPAVAWLGGRHPGRKGSLPKRWKTVSGIPHQQLVETLAAAGPNHCLDSWSFLARAFGALLAGDPHAARHFAYYAQLRAGLSLLASVGVGSFNRINFIINASGVATRLDPGPTANTRGLGTHAIVWKALSAWCADSALSSQFLEMIRLQGATLADCLSSVWPGFAPQTIAGNLIAIWGLDLKRAQPDQGLRNESSYSPQALNPLRTPPTDYLRFVAHAWEMCEPTTGGGFDKLDRHLLRASLWFNHGVAEAAGTPYDQGAIANRYSELPAAVQLIATQDFLTGATEKAFPDLIKRANTKADPASAPSMIARAMLLARLATGFTHSNFVDAGVAPSGQDLRPWVDQLAMDRGFWSPAAPILNLGDLWEDVEDALRDLAKATKSPPACRFDWAVQRPNGLSTIAEAERIGLWSLCG